MSLLSDLQSIDLSKITDARASIKVSVQSPELAAVLNGGAAQTALAGLGGSLAQVRGKFSQPADLLKPVIDAIGTLDGHFKLDGVPVSQYLDAVREGAGVMSSLFASFSDDPAEFGKIFGISLGQAFDKAASIVEGYANVGLDELAGARSLIERIESGVPTDPAAFAELAAEVLLPLPKDGLLEMRDNLRLILDGVAGINLPAGRNAGLLAAFDKVTAAALAADAAALRIAVDELERARLNTIASLRADLLAVFSSIGALRLDVALDPIIRVGGALHFSNTGILEFLDRWRADLAVAQKQIESIDAKQVAGFLERILAVLESNAQKVIADPIDAQVKRLQEWLRALLAHLPLQRLRGELSGFILGIAASIRDANLDAPIKAIFAEIDKVQAQLNPAALAADVKAILAKVQQLIDHALDGVISALEKIAAEVNAVAGQAEAVLGRASKALADFKGAVEQITVTVNNLGIEQAAQQIVDNLTKLRETAEKLLTVAPLPEPIKPTIQQLIDTLKGVDLNVVFKPVADAAGELKVPGEISVQITAALKAADDAVQNLIPTQLIQSIEAEVNDALNTLRGFNPLPLPDAVKTFLGEAADFLLTLDPRPHVADIAAPFEKVLGALDNIDPFVLLAPVTDAYDSLLGKIPIPPPSTAARRTAELINTVGERAGQAAVQPVLQAAPAGSVALSEAGRATPPPAAVAGQAVPHVGDVVRMFAFLPNKLREVLAALEAGPAGEVLGAVDSLCAGLARNLRAIEKTVASMESRIQSSLEASLAPLSFAQGKAQLAIRANFAAGGANIDAAIDIVGRAGPATLRAALAEAIDLTLGLARQSTAGVSLKAGSAIDRAAFALENSFLHGITHDLDAFLKALDPEPLAKAVDALVEAMIKKIPDMVAQGEALIQHFVIELRRILQQYSPGVQAQKFLVVLDVLREQLELLDPRRLALELSEIHAAIRDTVSAFDPALIAEQVFARIAGIATNLRALDPAALLGNLDFLGPTIARIENASPAKALEGVGASLKQVGDELVAVNPAALLSGINNLGPQLVDALQKSAEAIKKEIIALLEALRYASGSASASVSVEVNA